MSSVLEGAAVRPAGSEQRPVRRVTLVIATTTGGTGGHVHSLTRLLAADGLDVMVCGPAETERRFGFEAVGARFVPIPVGSSPDPRLILARSRIRAAASGCDVVHAHGLRAAALAASATPGSARLVVTHHNAQLGAGASRVLGRGLERLAARSATITLCVSPDLVEAALSSGAGDVRRTWIAAPPLEPPRRSRRQVREELGAGERPLLLAVGRLDRQKDYPTLIAALAGLAGLPRPPLLAIAGSGPERERLTGLLERSSAAVQLLGDRSDIADLLGAADALVSASVWEGCPLSVQEGLRAGLPFVGTDVGSVPDIVGEAGLLVTPSDPSALEGSLRRLLANPDLAAELGKRALARAAELPGEEQVAEFTISVYDDAIRSVSR